MSWVRIHDAAFTHPKVVGLSDKAFRLWVWGLTYAQLHLTDGFITADAMPGRLKRAADDLLSKRLWEPKDAGFQIHDYLDWNDSREVILKKRAGAKRRLEDFREQKNASRSADVKRVSSPTSATLLARSGVGITSGSGDSENGIFDPALGERAAAFIERYPQIYAKCRSGARYDVKEARDFDAFVDLVGREPNDQRLDQMCELFLLVKSRDFLNSPGTPRQFLHMLPECDRLLRENGR